MPAVESVSVGSTTVDVNPELNNIGIEFEYPIAGDNHYPSLRGRRSGSFLSDNQNLSLPEGYEDVPTGRMTGDHVGAEVTSSILDLHTNEPELWYRAVIELGDQQGYPFAANGYGSTNFGLHLHISNLPEVKARSLYHLCQEDWFRLFVCASMNEMSADPWRHGGVSNRDLRGERNFSRQYIVNRRSGNGHYEWRFPEPMLPEHFDMVLHFLRLLEVDGFDAAEEYARDAVYGNDQRLTVVQQHEILQDEVDGWPTEEAMRGENRTDASAARTAMDILE